MLLPAGVLYSCVRSTGAQQNVDAIVLEPKIEDLCRRHPEMGPCQYERSTCRATGGRVFTAGGEEITDRHEAEYDRKVMRVRLRSN